MKSVKEFFESVRRPPRKESSLGRAARIEYEKENSKSSTQNSTKIGGWNIVPDNHSRSQAVDHHPNKTAEDWNKLHMRITSHLNKVLKTSNMDTHEGIYYSRSLKHGIAARIDPNNKHINIITSLPHGKHTAAKDSDVHVIVESVDYCLTFVD